MVYIAPGLELLIIQDFVISCIDHIRNSGLLVFGDLPNVIEFYYNVKNCIC